MKSIASLIILIILIGCKAKTDISIPDNWKKENPDFANQGEAEEYYSWKHFRDEYKKQSYKRYEGTITKSENGIVYANDTLRVFCGKELKHIFTSGIIYPEIIRKNGIKGRISSITNVEELTFLESSPKVKRFRMWLSDGVIANPIVYLFELTNEKANGKNFTTVEFIQGSKLTFLKQGWLII